MKSVVAVFICIIYCCQAAAINGGKDVVVDGVAQSVPAVTIVTTESTKKDSPVKDTENVKDSIGPVPSTTPPPKPTTTNGTTTTTPIPTTTNATTTSTPIPTTTNATTTTPTPPTTTNATTTTPTPTTTNATTTTPTPTTTNATTTTPTPTTTNATTPVPKPTPTSAPVTTTVVPPSDRGFDGPSFIGGIVLASGLMAIGFVALKFYRARTELNYHTL